MTVLGKLLSDAAKFVGRKGEHAAGAPHLLHGVDLASFQGNPAQWRSEAGSLDFIAAKFTELRAGNARYLNPFAAADWAYAKQQGKARIGYLFGHPAAPAADTVSYFASELNRCGVEDGDGVCLDHETADGLTPAQVSDWAQDVCAGLEREFGRLPIVYTDRGFAQSGYCGGLGRYPLWVADPSDSAGHPQVPRPWKDWLAHQWSWNPLDRDVARFATVADMKAAIGRPSAAPTIPEDPVLILTGAGADTPVALPEGAKSVRLVSIAETTVNVEFAGAKVLSGVKLSWGHGRQLDVPKGSHSVRVYRPADGKPDVPVSVAVS